MHWLYIHVYVYFSEKKLCCVFQVADFFSGSGDHEKAAQLLVKTRHIEEALELCAAHNIHITETMAEDMTLPKTDSGM